jgi:hypothetical protein
MIVGPRMPLHAIMEVGDSPLEKEITQHGRVAPCEGAALSSNPFRTRSINNLYVHAY